MDAIADTASLPDLLEWADSECRAICSSTAAIREAEDELTSVSAILQTMGGPITWREAAGQV